MSHCKNNSVRDTAIGKRWICSNSERRAGSAGGGPSHVLALECGVVGFPELGDFIC